MPGAAHSYSQWVETLGIGVMTERPLSPSVRKASKSRGCPPFVNLPQTSLSSRSVLTVTGRCVLVGLAIGLPAGWWISRGFASLLFQVQPGDVSTYVIAAVTIALAALVASILPARRASRVDPLVSLRSV